MGMHTVLHKELSLVGSLREVSYNNTGTDLLRQLLNQCQHNCVVIFTNKILIFAKAVKVDLSCVGTASELLGESSLA